MTLLLWQVYLLAAIVVAALIAATFLGCGIGAHGRTWEVNRATRKARAQRDAAREQLALAEEALAAATHPIGSTDDRPETDLEGVVRAVTDASGRALPQPSVPVEDSEAWLWDTTPARCSAPCPHGHDHTCARSPKHTYPHRDVKQKGHESCTWDLTPDPAPCDAITINPFYAGGLDTELLCEHPDGAGHTGRHEAADGEVEYDNHGDTWVGGERL